MCRARHETDRHTVLSELTLYSALRARASVAGMVVGASGAVLSPYLQLFQVLVGNGLGPPARGGVTWINVINHVL